MEEMNNGVSKAPTTPPPHKFGILEHSRFADHFTYHPPTPGQVPRYNAINEAAKKFAEALCENVPESADLTHALRLIVQTKMTVNSHIATNPQLFQ